MTSSFMFIPSDIPDLMQGCSHLEAFASLPPSIRVVEEETAAGEEVVEEPIWSLDREQVGWEWGHCTLSRSSTTPVDHSLTKI